MQYAWPLPPLLVLTLSGTAFGQSETWEQFTTAIGKADAAKAESLCSKEYWSKPHGNTGVDFFGQAVRKRFGMPVISKEVRKGRAVLTANIQVRDRTVDRVYVYLVKHGANWQIDGIDENDDHEFFLNGSVSGHFHPRDLPPSKAMEELGQQILLATANVKLRKQLERKLMSERPSNNSGKPEKPQLKIFEFITTQKAEQVEGTYWSDKLSRGAIQFGKPGDQILGKAFLVVERTKTKTTRYRVIGKGYSKLGARHFLRTAR